MSGNTEIAREGEDLATAHLKKQGFSIVQRNYRFGHGEIDIIAQDGEYLVFVEVKTRTSDSYGHPLLSITPSKQKQLARIAQGYLFDKHIDNVPCRFDVITVEFKFGKPVLEHYPNAFMLM